MLRREFLKIAGWTGLATAGLPLYGSATCQEEQAADNRPNILWVIFEDTNDWMGCYGDHVVTTPHIDALAGRGVRFDRAYMTSAICSPVRSALATGMYQTAIDAHNHISSRPNPDSRLWRPNTLAVRTIPEIFRQAGYYTFSEGTVKDDYNFVWDPDLLYDHHNRAFGFKGAANGSDWSGCPKGRPFFGQIQLMGGKHRGIAKTTDRSAVPIPPYYPDHPVIRECIAHHYDTIVETDRELGQIVKKLRDDGLYDSTVIMFFSDHGMELLRHKQFLYEGGIRVPLMMAGPGLPKGAVRKDLVSGIDIGPTALALAKIRIPDHMHGCSVFADDFSRAFVVAARDRAGIAIDRIRAVVTERFKYIRNYMTDRPWMQPQYRDTADFTIVMKTLFEQGKLDAIQSRFMAAERPAEELYDLENDPHETNNLIYDPCYAEPLALYRLLLARWIVETDDKGQFPESSEELRGILQRQGGQVVNPEYDRVQ